jgi:hypothetical protein
MRDIVDSTTAMFMRFSKRRRMTEPNHPLGLRICAAMKCLSVTVSPRGLKDVSRKKFRHSANGQSNLPSLLRITVDPNVS